MFFIIRLFVFGAEAYEIIHMLLQHRYGELVLVLTTMVAKQMLKYCRTKRHKSFWFCLQQTLKTVLLRHYHKVTTKLPQLRHNFVASLCANTSVFLSLLHTRLHFCRRLP